MGSLCHPTYRGAGMVSRFRTVVFCIWQTLPFGYLLRFRYEGLRITLRKNLWVVIDNGRGTSTDMLPLTLVSQKLVDECGKRLTVKYKLGAATPPTEGAAE